MPDYNYTITVPSGKSKSDPQLTELKLAKGVIARGEITFPSGCQGLCHCVIAKTKGQLYPANPDGSFHGDKFPIILTGGHELDTTPYKLVAKTWNDDDIFDHTIQIHLSVLPREQYYPYLILQNFLKVIMRILGI